VRDHGEYSTADLKVWLLIVIYNGHLILLVHVYSLLAS
jgi:hypothetical protein